MKDLTKIRESYLTEDDLAPKPLFYPTVKKKEPVILKDNNNRHDRTSFSDQVCGILNPIVYALNKGKEIKSNSSEHKSLLRLLELANIS